MWESIIYYRYLLCPNRFANINNILIEANYCDMIIDEKLRINNKFVRDRVIQSHMSIKTCKVFEI